MRTPRASDAPLRAALLGIGLLALQGCSGSGLRVQHVPKDGYGQTTNYQFQARVHADESGACKMMTVRVKALSKRYVRGAPPPRLQLFDDDCMSPLRFERVNYLSEETGERVNLHGPDVIRFWSENVRLENELVGWLWRAGVI